MRWPQLSRRTQRRSRGRLRFEPLEDRRLMACLAIGVTLETAALGDNGTCNVTGSAAPLLVGKVGQTFALQIRVQDVRTGGPPATGVTALLLHVSWDPAFVTDVVPPTAGPIPLGNPLLTDAFPLQRTLDAFNPAAGPAVPAPPATPAAFLPFANLQGLRGAALPNLPGTGMAIGVTREETFSTLQFQANRATTSPNESPFTIRLAGSMSFADASVLEQVVPGTNTARVDDITVQARLQIDPVIISGMKFDDVNGNATKDDGELGISNWTIQLIRAAGPMDSLDPTDPVIATTTTGQDGSYQFAVTEVGSYFVREVQQPGWIQTTIDDPAPITTAGVDRPGIDFGNRRIPPVDNSNKSLSGFVFADTNLNGSFDAGEDGLPNVSVQLRRTDVVGTPVTVLTGPDGWYHFENLTSGIYDVVEMQPAGFVNASISRGLVFPAGSQQPNEALRGTTDGFNAFRGINLNAGANAVDFNFGDNVVPTKRRFVASVDPFAETCSVLGLNCVTVRGTAGNDQIDFVPDTDVVRVTVNNLPSQVFSRDAVNIVKIDALAGNDTVTLFGSAADDVAHSQANSCTVQFGSYRPGDYAVVAVNAERTIVNGGLGNDLAVLRDSAVDEVLTATNDPFIGPVTELESALNMTRFVRAVAFERTRAVSVSRVGINDVDTAILNGQAIDLIGKWV